MAKLTFAVAALVAVSLSSARVQAQTDGQPAFDQFNSAVEASQTQVDQEVQVQAVEQTVAAGVQLSQLDASNAVQPPVAADASAPAATDVTAPTGPSIDAATLSPRLASHVTSKTNAMHRRPSSGAGVGLMILGGAGLITGLIIGGDAGTVIAVGGALVGLYGLYVYLGRPHGMEQGNRIGLGYKLNTN
jgi:hypothetical protein